MRLLSWNVNGIRAIERKGFVDWLHQEGPDILCLQETKAWREQLSKKLLETNGYHTYFAGAERKGYSGVALYTREKPGQVVPTFGDGRFDEEGRVLQATYPDFILYNVYFPNGKASKERLEYKMEFYNYFLEVVKEQVKAGKRVIVCGDVNTAHQEIDLARPRENEDISGFLPQEREWIDKFLQTGFYDTFRLFNKEGENYSWWDYKTRARSRNVGWRIDYVFVSENLKDKVADAFIMSEVDGSDHCPVGIEFDL